MFDKRLPYDFLRDIVLGGGVVDLPFVMEVAAGAGDVAEFIAHAKANPGKVNMASFGTGTIQPIWRGSCFKIYGRRRDGPLCLYPRRAAGPW